MEGILKKVHGITPNYIHAILCYALRECFWEMRTECIVSTCQLSICHYYTISYVFSGLLFSADDHLGVIWKFSILFW